MIKTIFKSSYCFAGEPNLAVVYDPKTNLYAIETETSFYFDSRKTEMAYYNSLFDELTEWMILKSYRTDIRIESWVILDSSKWFPSIEIAYSMFKFDIEAMNEYFRKEIEGCENNV